MRQQKSPITETLMLGGFTLEWGVIMMVTEVKLSFGKCFSGPIYLIFSAGGSLRSASDSSFLSQTGYTFQQISIHVPKVFPPWASTCPVGPTVSIGECLVCARLRAGRAIDPDMRHRFPRAWSANRKAFPESRQKQQPIAGPQKIWDA